METTYPFLVIRGRKEGRIPSKANRHLQSEPSGAHPPSGSGCFAPHQHWAHCLRACADLVQPPSILLAGQRLPSHCTYPPPLRGWLFCYPLLLYKERGHQDTLSLLGCSFPLAFSLCPHPINTFHLTVIQGVYPLSPPLCHPQPSPVYSFSHPRLARLIVPLPRPPLGLTAFRGAV